jgi:hypothetical protein
LAHHEYDLVPKIISVIRDTFESYDDGTSAILQSFFGAYSVAVKYAVAKNTRQLIVTEGYDNNPKRTKKNDKNENSIMSNDGLNKDMMQKTILEGLTLDKRLEEFGQECLLHQQYVKAEPLLDKVIVGFLPWQVQDVVDIVQKCCSKDDDKNKNKKDT